MRATLRGGQQYVKRKVLHGLFALALTLAGCYA